MRCDTCGTESTTGRKFCAVCGSRLSRRCPQCGAENAPLSAFCEDCATALVGREAPAAPGPRQAVATTLQDRATIEQLDDSTTPEGERKIVTALFADLKGSTALMEALDPEAAHAIVATALQSMAEAVRRYEGYVARTTGDGIFALFGAPAAHEDHPQRALYAALEMQRELRAEHCTARPRGCSRSKPALGSTPVRWLAYSVETSEKVEYRLVGHTANLASRLEALAPVGSIAVEPPFAQQLEGAAHVRRLHAQALRRRAACSPTKWRYSTALSALSL
jgi:class 3 adenylate cyclase